MFSVCCDLQMSSSVLTSRISSLIFANKGKEINCRLRDQHSRQFPMFGDGTSFFKKRVLEEEEGELLNSSPSRH